MAEKLRSYISDADYDTIQSEQEWKRRAIVAENELQKIRENFTHEKLSPANLTREPELKPPFENISDLMSWSEQIVGVKLELHGNDEEYLIRQFKRYEDTQKGNGARAMLETCGFADRRGARLGTWVLRPAPKLEAYYQQFGFSPIEVTRNPASGYVLMMRRVKPRPID